MNKTLLVGLTGGIGSGKSTVAKIFQLLKVPVYFADDRGKWLLTHDQILKDKVISLFGKESYLEDGRPNRSLLADKVFSNTNELEKLNALVHPAVATDFEEWVNQNKGLPYLLKEAALLFENDSYKALDYTISVMAPKALRLQRVLLRDIQRSEEQVLQIIDKQVSDNERKRLSDFLIENNGKKSLISQVLAMHKQLISTRD